MKKFLYFISIIFLALVLFSCKSKEVASDEVVVTEEGSETDVLEDVEVEEEISNEKEAEKEMADRGFIGWIDTGVKNPSFSSGIVKITTNSRLGTFCIYAVDHNDKSYPVLSSLNECTSSSFYLKAGKKIFKLAANEKVDTGTAGLENGIRIVYNIKNTATVIVEITVFPSVEGKVADTLKFNINVKNNGKKIEEFSLKAVLDTILGETGGYHFYNWEGVPVKNEVLLRSMNEDKWFVSKNDRAAMEILLNGGDVTSPEFVSLANFKTLEKAKWLPSMQAYGAFDTVLSYNNSAVGVFWPKKSLYPNDSYSTTFYVSLALDGRTPNGYKYVYGIKTPEVKKETVDVKSEIKEYFDNVPVIVEDNVPEIELPVENEAETVVNVNNNEVQDTQVAPEVVTETVPEENIVPNIEFNVKNISKDHLTTEYIQSLIDRIAELEKDGSSANRGEILQLNAELDAILSILR